MFGGWDAALVNQDYEINWLISPQYEGVTKRFTEKLAGVVLGGKVGFIDIYNRFIIKPQFENADDIHGFNLGLSAVKNEGGNLAASKIRNLECPSYEICLIDYGCGKFNRKYILWSNILDLRSRGINIARTARRLGVSRNTVRHLQSLSLEEVLQHKERHYKLHAYEQAVASLLTSFPPFPAAALATTCGNIIRTFRTSARRPSTIMSSSSGRSTIFLRPDNHRSHSPKEWEPGPSYT